MGLAGGKGEDIIIRVISSMATREILSELVEQFENRSGYKVKLESVGGVAAAKRVEAGEAFDVVILASDAIDRLISSGCIAQGSKVDFVSSGIAVAVRKGAKIPDISSEEAVKQAVSGAKTIGYSTGPSGEYLAGLFQRWGIADQIKDRIVRPSPGIPIGSLVAKGEVELGFQQLSELLNEQGITVLGPLPPDIQYTTIFSAGITVKTGHEKNVKELLKFLTSPEAAGVRAKMAGNR